MDKLKKVGDITQEEIDAWKAKYGKNSLTQVSVESNGENYEFIIKRPGRTVLDAIAEYGMKKEVTKANKVMVTSCVLAGDMEAMENDGAVYGAVLQEISALMEKTQTAVKKL